MLSIDQYQEVTRNGAPSARVYNSAAQTITTGTITPITFDSERFDRWGMHSTSSNTSRLTVPYGGIYYIGGCVGWSSSAAGNYRDMGIRVDGSTIISYDRDLSVVTGLHIHQINTLWSLQAGQYVELIVQHDKGSDLDTYQAASYAPEFWIQWQSRP